MKNVAARMWCMAALFVTLTLGHSAPAAAENVVVTWNRQMLSAIEQNPPRPTVVCRQLFIVSTAMYEAWCAYDAIAVSTVGRDDLKRPVNEHTDEFKAAAVSYAAYRALTEMFPNQERQFRRTLRELGYGPRLVDSTDITTPEGIGNTAALDVIADRADDGSNWQNNFADTTSAMYPSLYQPVNQADPRTSRAPGGNRFNPNRWQPLRVPTGALTDGDGNPVIDHDDPATFVDQTFLTPHWGAVRPFALVSGDQYRPGPPPALGDHSVFVDSRGHRTTADRAYRAQFNEVLQHSETLTDRMKCIAEFWADGPRSFTPPGHWNQLAYAIAAREHYGIDACITMFFALNGAMLDASIAAWDCKRHYDAIRPVSAIRNMYAHRHIWAWGGPDMGTLRIAGIDFQPYQQTTFITPAFPEYVSGHSTFSRAAREVLLACSGSDLLYDGVTQLAEDYDGDGHLDMAGEHIVLPGRNIFESSPASTVVLRWETMLEAANEAGISRLYGGIHMQDGDVNGRQLGKKVGQNAWRRATAFIDPHWADLNRDGWVDAIDFSVLYELIWAGEYRPEADLNSDGRLDFIDLFILLAEFD